MLTAAQISLYDFRSKREYVALRKTSSLHGTVVSIVQHPSESNVGIVEQKIQGKKSSRISLHHLPHNGTLVLDVVMRDRIYITRENVLSDELYESMPAFSSLDHPIKLGKEWLDNPIRIQKLDDVERDGKQPKWAAYHKIKQGSDPIMKVNNVVLLIFYESADTRDMMKHILDNALPLTNLLNEWQITIL